MSHAASSGLNTYNLLLLLENLSQLDIGPSTADDITEELVLQFLKEGYQRIVSLDTRWPWFQSSYTFSTIPDTHNYYSGMARTMAYSPDTPVSPNAAALNLTLEDVQQVIAVINNTNSGNELVYIDHFKAQQIWVGTNDVAGIPAYWSLWSRQLFLWPMPDATTYTMTLRAFRAPDLTWLDNTDAGSEQLVDLNQELHMLLINFTMARIFQYQEDTEMAAVYMNHYNQGAAIIQQNLNAPSSNQPLILNGGLQLGGGAWWTGVPGMYVQGTGSYPNNSVPIGRWW